MGICLRNRHQIGWLGVAVFFLCLSIPSADASSDDLWKIVPEDALGVAMIPDPGATDATMIQFAAQVQLPIGPPLLMLKALGQIGEGLDEDDPIAAILMPSDDADWKPIPVIALPTDDYDALVKPWKPEKVTDTIFAVTLPNEMPALAAKKGDFTLLVLANQQATLEKILASTGRFTKSVDAWDDWIEKNLAVVVMTPEGLKQVVFGAIDQTEKGMKTATASLEKTDPEMAKQISEQLEMTRRTLQVYRKIFGNMADQVDLWAAGVAIDQEGFVTISSRATMADGSPWADAFATLEAPKKMLTNLPQGPYVFAADGAFNKKVAKLWNQYSVDLLEVLPQFGELSSEVREKFITLMERSNQDLDSLSILFGISEPGEGILQRTVYLIKTNDAQAFMKQQLSTTEEIIKLAEDTGIPLWSKGTTIGETTIDGRKIQTVTIDITQSIQGEGTEETLKILKEVYSPDGKIISYFLPLDEKNILVGFSEDGLKLGIKAFEKGTPSRLAEPMIEPVAKRLPEGAQWVILVSVDGTLQWFKYFSDKIKETPIINIKIDMEPAPPIAVGVIASEEGFEKRTVVSPETIKAVYAAVMKLFVSAQQEK